LRIVLQWWKTERWSHVVYKTGPTVFHMRQQIDHPLALDLPCNKSSCQMSVSSLYDDCYWSSHTRWATRWAKHSALVVSTLVCIVLTVGSEKTVNHPDNTYAVCLTQQSHYSNVTYIILLCRMTNYELLCWLVEMPSCDVYHYRMINASRSTVCHYNDKQSSDHWSL